MADLTPTANKVSDASPNFSIRIALVAAVAINASQTVYINSDGKAALADASAAGTAVVIGVALESVSAGQSVPILVMGFCEGLGVSSVAYGTLLTLSDTAGAIDNGAGSPTVTAPIGRVIALTDGDLSKVVFVNCLYNLCVVPA